LQKDARFPEPAALLNINLGVLGMALYELPAGRNLIAHEHTEYTIRFC
jgi:hypothetical protein